MIDTNEEADLALADAVWWFKGFAAARPPGIDEGAGEHRDLEAKIGHVREWIGRLIRGRVRRLGDEKAIVLTYVEFERLADLVAQPGCLKTRGYAGAVISDVMEAYREEVRRSREPEDLDIPF